MKRKSPWVSITTLFFSLSLAHAGQTLPADDTTQAIERLTETLHQFQDQVRGRTLRVNARTGVWDELQNFHNSLLQAMATDPAFGDNNPKNSAAAIDRTRDIARQLGNLVRHKAVAIRYGAGEEFDKYVEFVTPILKQRELKNYTNARAIAKVGFNKGAYTDLCNQIEKHLQGTVDVSLTLNESDRATILESLSTVHAGVDKLKGQIEKNRAATQASQAILDETRKKENDLQQQLNWVRRLSQIVGITGGFTLIFGLAVVRHKFKGSAALPEFITELNSNLEFAAAAEPRPTEVAPTGITERFVPEPEVAKSAHKTLPTITTVASGHVPLMDEVPAIRGEIKRREPLATTTQPPVAVKTESRPPPARLAAAPVETPPSQSVRPSDDPLADMIDEIFNAEQRAFRKSLQSL